MKVAIYFDGVGQLVLTPENETEKRILDAIYQDVDRVTIGEPIAKASIYRGSFYACAGGWVRESADRDSLIVRIETKAVT